jgi:hypothetical protein
MMGNVTIADLAARKNTPLLNDNTDTPHTDKDFVDYN